MRIKDLKKRVFNNNDEYFKFIRKNEIIIYSVEFTKSHNIQIYYKSNRVKKGINKSKKVCV